MSRYFRTLCGVLLGALVASGCEIVGLGGPSEPPYPTLTIENGVYVYDWEPQAGVDSYVLHLDLGDEDEDDMEIEVTAPPVRVETARWEVDRQSEHLAILSLVGLVREASLMAVAGGKRSEATTVHHQYPTVSAVAAAGYAPGSPDAVFGVEIRAYVEPFSCPDPTDWRTCGPSVGGAERAVVLVNGTAHEITTEGRWFVATGPGRSASFQISASNPFGSTALSPAVSARAFEDPRGGQ